MSGIPERVIKLACDILDLKYQEVKFVASGLVFDGVSEEKLEEMLIGGGAGNI